MNDNTIKFTVPGDDRENMHRILRSVFDALSEKGYNPINQIVGYLLTEDPTYITNYNNARAMICKLDRDELLQELVQCYLFDKQEAVSGAAAVMLQPQISSPVTHFHACSDSYHPSVLPAQHPKIPNFESICNTSLKKVAKIPPLGLTSPLRCVTIWLHFLQGGFKCLTKLPA